MEWRGASLHTLTLLPGLKVVTEKFPEGMIVGELPESIRPKGGRAKAGSEPEIGQLTHSNLELIREQLEEQLLADDGAETYGIGMRHSGCILPLPPPSSSQVHGQHGAHIA